MSEAIDFAAVVRPGDSIAWSGAAVEPTELLRQFEAALERMPSGKVLLNLGLTTSIDATRLAARHKVRALGGATTNRRFQEIGALDVLACHYSALPDLVASGRLAIDVVLAQVAPEGTGFNCGPMVDYLADAIPRARFVAAEVNEQLPVTFGETAVDPADIDAVVPVSRAPIELASRPAGAVEKAIGEHVARFVGDGATLEVGLGSLPDAVLECLSTRRDLGIHSGTIGDRVAELAEMGVITNRAKAIDTGLTVTAGLLGTSKVYRWAHRNPSLHLRSPRYTHDVVVQAQIPGLIGINSALEVDLTGQMNAEVAGNRHIGMVGGHGDFMRGCGRSPGGRAIVAMEATARSGKLSRIVPRLSGGVVTTARSDADIVVTEYGAAELKGRTVSERAEALIAIAHPDFRHRLATEAARLM
jgi:acetyl-CoA hydrolase